MQDGTYIIYATMNNYKESYKAITFFGGGWATTDVGLNRVNPCASPIVSVSVAPTVSVNPSASVNPLNPNDNPLNFIQDWYILLGWLGITEDVAAFLTGAMIIIGFGLGAIWLTAKAGITGNYSYYAMGLSAGMAFILVCYANIWPIWLLYIGAFLVVMLFAGFIVGKVLPNGGGGNGGSP
jgi:hypothetical protein